MRRPIAATLLLMACDPVASETLVDELRVMGWQAEPPYMDAIGGTVLTAELYQPTRAAVDVLLWTCVPGPLGCFEAGTEDETNRLATFTSVVQPEDGRAQWAAEPLGFYLPATLGGAELPPVFAWALACEQGLCPIIDAVRADPDPNTAAWEDALETLANPFDLMQTLPLQGTAATFRTFDIRLPSPDGVTPANPVVALTTPSEPLTVASGTRLELTFSVATTATTLAYPVASRGGFEISEVAVEDGSATVTFVAGGTEAMDLPPLEPGDVEVFVTFEGEDGGSATWRGRLNVTE